MYISEKENPPDATEADAVAAYSARKDKALATIVLSVDPSLLYMLGDPEDPVQVWKKLASQFQRKTWANKLVLRRKLHSLRLKEGASVQKHIKEMTELFNELAVIGAELDEEDRVVHLLASLPDSYDTLVTALEANEKVPTMELVIDRLLYEEKKTKDRQTEPDEALFITDKTKSKSKRPGIRCHYCHKLGHMQKDCYERKLKLPRKGDKVGEKHSAKRKSESCNSIGLLVATHALSTGCLCIYSKCGYTAKSVSLHIQQVWICLFTCLVVRAVHLDVVTDMSTQSFLRCLKRFASRRGLPRKILSDNGKTFRAASKYIKAVFADHVIEEYLAGLGCAWIFNVEYAPWWGGAFKRMVKSTKHCLQKMIGRAQLTLDELLTAIVEIEAVINSRPLSYVSGEDVE